MIKIFAVNPFREVTYIVSDEKSKKCVIIDCGAQEQFEFDRITDYIQQNELQPTMLLNTHAHIDHILGISYMKSRYNIPFAVSSLDQPTLDIAKVSGRTYGLVDDNFVAPTIDIDLNCENNREIIFGDTIIKVIPTPGHTSGGVSFLIEESGVLFTGDTLFQGSIGRTDLPTGDYDVLMESIIKTLIPLAKEREITLYPGHGNHTTIAQELMNNPFIVEVLTNSVNPEIE
ncbi:MAG: MBL fold metallo-hydrolase [Rikenellaceae bacterium]